MGFRHYSTYFRITKKNNYNKNVSYDKKLRMYYLRFVIFMKIRKLIIVPYVLTLLHDCYTLSYLFTKWKKN